MFMQETRKSLVENIHGLLSIYKNFIVFQNSSGFFDINRECEDIFCKLLNILYGTNLQNLNLKHNYPAIDLGDNYAGICFQITSDNSAQKIKHTIELFEKYMMYEKFFDLNILVLGIKKDYKIDIPDYVSIIDLKDIADSINNCKNNEVLKEIRDHLANELAVKGLIQPQGNSILNQLETPQIKFGQSYLKGFFADIEEASYNDTDDVNYFAKELALLPKELRELIYAATTRCRVKAPYCHFYEHIFFDSARLNSLLQYNPRITELFRQLISFNYLDYEVSEEEPNIYAFKFLNRGKDYDILNDIVKYCAEKELDLKAIIVDLDFTILD